MKTNSILIAIFIGLSLVGCKKEMGHYDAFYFTNNSSHKVEYQVYGFISKFDSFQDSNSSFLPSESKFYFEDSRVEGGGELKEDYAIYPAPFFGDSVIVCYDDTICITHKHISTIPMNNILNSGIWFTESIGENKSQHTFSFTDTDYQEAYDNR
ncbi:MAG: hypothetical protein ABF242_01625 [Flavobacteriales bacterium]